MPIPALHLPQLTPRPGHQRMARRRAAAMILIYVLIIAHIIQWRITGRTWGPFVASDAMETLENGVINGGFLILAAVVLVTALFGRFLCGWACHMGGLQDLSAWLLKKCGIRPRLLHARVIAIAPIALGLYMFAWPMFRRDLLAPAMERWWPAALPYIGQYHDFPGWSARLTTSNMWERLPSLAVAIPFLLSCGFLTVYFLGARGFCRFACPYGGVLSPLEQLAPARIKVDPAACDECGLCTAACTSGVRVMEEVRAYGRVVSRHCTRTLDCVAVCPNTALKVGLARPALFRGRAQGPAPRVLHDLTWPEEFFTAGMFLLAFLGTRSLYNFVPMLMATALAACYAGLMWKSWRILRDRDCRFVGFQLRRAGRLRPAGAAILSLAALASLFVAHSAAIRVTLWRAGLYDSRVTLTRDIVLTGRPDLVPPDQAHAADRALQLFAAAASYKRGGWALTDTPLSDIRAGWLHLVRGDYPDAESTLRRAVDSLGPTDGLCADIARVMLLQNRPADAAAYLEPLCRDRPAFTGSREVLCWVLTNTGHADRAAAILEEALQRDPAASTTRAQLASLYVSMERLPEALAHLRRAAADAPADGAILSDLAVVRFMSADVDGAIADLSRAAELSPASAAECYDRAAQMLVQAGRAAEARPWKDRAEQRRRGAP